MRQELFKESYITQKVEDYKNFQLFCSLPLSSPKENSNGEAPARNTKQWKKNDQENVYIIRKQKKKLACKCVYRLHTVYGSGRTAMDGSWALGVL